MSVTNLSEAEELFISYCAELNQDSMGLPLRQSDSSSDEIEIVKELKVTLQQHQCELCCEGTFLVDRMLQFGGIMDTYACEVCLKSFKSKKTALSHAKLHEREQEINGDVDVVSSPVVHARSGVAVNDSMEVGEESKLYCHECDKVYMTANGLRKHCIKRHSVGEVPAPEKKKHYCDLCETRFSSEKKLEKHKNIYHRASSNIYSGTQIIDIRRPASVSIDDAEASVCDTSADLKNCDIIDRPRIAETSSSELSCSKCQITFKSKTGLKRHNTNQHCAVHSCSICGTIFKSSKLYGLHCNMKTCVPPPKLKQKLITCPGCHKSFCFNKSFEEHVCNLEMD